MANHGATKNGAAKLLARAAKAEQRLLKRERKAEQSVLTARAKVGTAQAKLDRRRATLADAEANLRDHQAARAAGPHAVDGDATSQPPTTVATVLSNPSPDADPAIVLPGQPDGQPTSDDAALILPSPPVRAPRGRAKRSSGARDSPR